MSIHVERLIAEVEVKKADAERELLAFGAKAKAIVESISTAAQIELTPDGKGFAAKTKAEIAKAGKEEAKVDLTPKDGLAAKVKAEIAKVKDPEIEVDLTTDTKTFGATLKAKMKLLQKQLGSIIVNLKTDDRGAAVLPGLQAFEKGRKGGVGSLLTGGDKSGRDGKGITDIFATLTTGLKGLTNLFSSAMEAVSGIGSAFDGLADTMGGVGSLMDSLGDTAGGMASTIDAAGDGVGGLAGGMDVLGDSAGGAAGGMDAVGDGLGAMANVIGVVVGLVVAVGAAFVSVTVATAALVVILPIVAVAIAAVGVAVLALVGALTGLVAVLVALVLALTAITPVLAAIPAMLLGFGTAAAAVMLAIKGVTDAIGAQQAVLEAEEKGIDLGTEAMRRRRDALEAVEAAQRGVRNAMENLAAAQHGVILANEALEQSQHGNVLAAEALERAQKALVDAYKEEKKAAEDLVEARDQAAENLVQMRFAAEQSVLSEQGAVLALAAAQKRLADINKELRGDIDNSTSVVDEFTGRTYKIARVTEDATEKELERRQAVLAVAQAELSLRMAQEARQEAAEELVKAEKKGVEQSDLVVNAMERVADATEAIVEAQRSQREAERGLTDARRSEREASRGVQSALNGERDALEGVADAKRGLRNALEALDKQMKESDDVLTKYNDAMAKLSPSARIFVENLKPLKEKFEELSLVAQEGIFSGLNTAIENLTPLLGPIETAIGGVSRAIGGMIGGIAEMLNKPPFNDMFERILGSNTTMWETFADGMVDMAAGFIALTDAAAPLAEGLTNWIRDMAAAFKDWAVAGNEDGSLAETFGRALDVLKTVTDIILNFSSGLFELSKSAGPLIDTVLEGLKEMSAEFKEFAGSDTMKTFFENLAPIAAIFIEIFKTLGEASFDAFEEMLPTIEKLGLMMIAFLDKVIPLFLDFFSDEGVTKAIESFADTALKFLAETGEDLMPVLIEFVRQLLPVLESFFVAMEPLIEQLGEFLPKFFREVGPAMADFFTQVGESLKDGELVDALTDLLDALTEEHNGYSLLDALVFLAVALTNLSIINLTTTIGAMARVAAVAGDVLGAFTRLGEVDYGALFGKIGAALDTLKDKFIGLKDGAIDALKNVANAFINMVNTLGMAWNSLSFTMEIPNDLLDKPGVKRVLELTGLPTGLKFNTPDIPGIPIPPIKHQGGIFRSMNATGEGLAVLRDGERVLTPDQTRRYDSGLIGGSQVNMEDAILKAMEKSKRVEVTQHFPQGISSRQVAADLGWELEHA